MLTAVLLFGLAGRVGPSSQLASTHTFPVLAFVDGRVGRCFHGCLCSRR